MFESVVRMIHQIHVPLHWFSEVIPRDGDINEKVVYFHKLSPFKENCIRTIEKYVILFRGKLKFYVVKNVVLIRIITSFAFLLF